MGLPDEIDVSDLDADRRSSWTEEQVERARRSGLLEALESKDTVDPGDDEEEKPAAGQTLAQLAREASLLDAARHAAAEAAVEGNRDQRGSASDEKDPVSDSTAENLPATVAQAAPTDLGGGTECGVRLPRAPRLPRPPKGWVETD